MMLLETTTLAKGRKNQMVLLTLVPYTQTAAVECQTAQTADQ
jgi:hypothetical protein